jgi:pantoate--beta-alanine ligase
MEVVKNIKDIKNIIKIQKKAGKTIGFVPTMGFLHNGHISLINKAVSENDFTIISIFVNPIQFGPNEDYNRYPRDMEGDITKAEEAGADIVFLPSNDEMYPDGYSTYVDVYGITDKLCGRSRPGHFKGVCTVVLKLFNIVKPDKAYFGQKDAQQVAVIYKMVKELDLDIIIVTCPIVRESDGLALSSRNVYLSSEERKEALVLYQSLNEAKAIFEGGERNCNIIREQIIEKINSKKHASIDYVEILEAGTLEYVNEIKSSVLIALAVKFGKTRLIDNMILEVE